MYDKSLAIDILESMLESINKIQKRTSQIKTVDDFLRDDNSLILLDSVCMQLIAIGQGVKDLDKATHNSLLLNYTNIPWRSIAGVRDILSHNYFSLNAETVFGVLGDELNELEQTLQKILAELGS